ncbi:MAG: hypothetical protein QM765_35860 [Myxococcales bacterium]
MPSRTRKRTFSSDRNAGSANTSARSGRKGSRCSTYAFTVIESGPWGALSAARGSVSAWSKTAMPTPLPPMSGRLASISSGGNVTRSTRSGAVARSMAGMATGAVRRSWLQVLYWLQVMAWMRS